MGLQPVGHGVYGTLARPAGVALYRVPHPFPFPFLRWYLDVLSLYALLSVILVLVIKDV